MGNIVVESSVTRAYHPDMVQFSIHIGKVADNSRELTAYNKAKLDEIMKGIESLDIDEENLSEDYFRISVNREYKDDAYIENGFKLDAGYTITTYLDYELMGEVREMLTSGELEFSVEYTLEDESEIRDTLLDEAVKSSKAKANIIAHAAGREVGELVAVKYSDVQHRPVMMSTRGANVEAQPHDIEITESIEVEWSIE